MHTTKKPWVWWWLSVLCCGAWLGAACKPAVCGDGALNENEACDDANNTDNDGCNADCSLSAVVQVVVGTGHTCAQLNTGAVRCWGNGGSGSLGYANDDDIGDDENPAEAGDVNVGGVVSQLTAGAVHTCAVLDTGAVRCWGNGGSGPLGYGNNDNIGDDEDPASVGDVPVGGEVVQLDAGSSHTCAVLDSGALRCWGNSSTGELGYGNTNDVGDDETPASIGDVPVGGSVVQVSGGLSHTCAVLDTGNLRCWGRGGSGELGYGNTNDLGDDETPASVGDVPVGGLVAQVSAGVGHTCAVLQTGSVRCWGDGSNGELGYGNTNNIGDDETPAEVGDVNVGGSVVQVVTGDEHSCALLSTGNVRCWGFNSSGQLGYGNTENIGDNETPAEVGDVPVGGSVVQLEASENQTCAVLASGSVRCWGENDNGQLGYGNLDTLGDDETPAQSGDIVVF